MSSIVPPVTFGFTAIWIDDSSDGNGALLSYLAKPTNPAAVNRKLRNWRLWLTPGQSTEQRRSRRQVEAGMLDVWNGLHDAVKIGERFSKMAVFHQGEWRIDPTMKKLGEWAEPVGDEDLTRWKNWLPLAHYAAAFRSVLYSRELGTLFASDRTKDERIRIVHRLLTEEKGWVSDVIEGGFGWLSFARLHGRVQSPADTMIFTLRNETSEANFAKTDPRSLN